MTFIKYLYTRLKVAAYTVASILLIHHCFIETVWYKVFACVVIAIICLMEAIMCVEDIVKENRKK